jgi:hypothetical protein
MNAAGPFVCNTNALSAEQRALHRQLEAELRAALVQAHELPNGYKFRFRPGSEAYQALTRITPLEHACCPFFSISIRVEASGELFWQLTGSEGVKQFIRMEFAEWFNTR